MITEVRDSIITRFFALLMIPSLLMVTTASCKKEIQPELSTQMKALFSIQLKNLKLSITNYIVISPPHLIPQLLLNLIQLLYNRQ